MQHEIEDHSWCFNRELTWRDPIHKTDGRRDKPATCSVRKKVMKTSYRLVEGQVGIFKRMWGGLFLPPVPWLRGRPWALPLTPLCSLWSAEQSLFSTSRNRWEGEVYIISDRRLPMHGKLVSHSESFRTSMSYVASHFCWLLSMNEHRMPPWRTTSGTVQHDHVHCELRRTTTVGTGPVPPGSQDWLKMTSTRVEVVQALFLSWNPQASLLSYPTGPLIFPFNPRYLYLADVDRKTGIIYHKFLQIQSLYTAFSWSLGFELGRPKIVFFCDTLYYALNGGLCETKCTWGCMYIECK